MAEIRREILKVFKKLHRTRMKTFAGDDYALKATRQKINEEYLKYKGLTNETTITELNKFAGEVEFELRTSVIQMVEKEPGLYKVNITPDTALLDNIPQEVSKSTKSEDVTKTKK